MQVIIRNERSVNLIAKENTDSQGQMGSNYHLRVLPLSHKLYTEIMEIPTNAETPARRINMISQHVSGRTYLASIFDRRAFRESKGIKMLRALLDRTLRMYREGKLKGDLIFHKTAHNGCQYADQTWPIKVDSNDNQSEHWFLTGNLNWVYRYRDNLNYTTAPEVYSTSQDNVDEYERYMVEVGRADKYQANKICKYQYREAYGKFLQRMQRYMQRLELVNILKSTAGDRPTWDYYMDNCEVYRFGAWCYKDGRIYYYKGGSSGDIHHIQLHGNRNTDLGGIL